MMSRLRARADAVVRSAQRRRLEHIAAAVRAHGLAAETEAGSVICRGKRLVCQWLSDPLLRFIGSSRS